MTTRWFFFLIMAVVVLVAAVLAVSSSSFLFPATVLPIVGKVPYWCYSCSCCSCCSLLLCMCCVSCVVMCCRVMSMVLTHRAGVLSVAVTESNEASLHCRLPFDTSDGIGTVKAIEDLAKDILKAPKAGLGLSRCEVEWAAINQVRVLWCHRDAIRTAPRRACMTVTFVCWSAEWRLRRCVGVAAATDPCEQPVPAWCGESPGVGDGVSRGAQRWRWHDADAADASERLDE